MAQEPLSDEEIKTLRALLKYAPTLQQEMEYEAARRLLVTSWKNTIIALGAFLAFIIMMREQLRLLWSWMWEMLK